MSSLNGAGRTVQLADGPHVLRFDLNAFSEIEEHFGDLGAMQAALKAKPFSTARVLLAAALEGITPHEAGKLTAGVSIQQLVNDLSGALMAAINTEDNLDPPVPAATTAEMPSADPDVADSIARAS